VFEKPFRWNITRQEQLGKLLPQTADAPVETDDEMLPACARIIASAGDRDLIFVGRSPENFFDYLSGLLLDTSWHERMTLLHFSMRFEDEAEIRKQYPQAIAAMRDYLQSQNLSPQRIATRAHPVAFVDLVYSGETFSHLMMLLHHWCREIAFDWKAVQRRIRIVGITSRTHNSPNTRRWQQHATWLHLLETNAVKNISIDSRFWSYLGDRQDRLTLSYHPAHWGQQKPARPVHDEKHIAALRYAHGLFKRGQSRADRDRLITLLSQQTAVKEAWMRRLIQELRF